MFRFWVAMMLAAPVFAGDPLYEFSGRLAPEGHAMVSLFGASEPFQAQTESDDNGRFHFRNLRAGAYTVAVYMPGRGEARQTVEIGPGTADSERRVNLTLEFKDSDFVYNDAVRRRNTVSSKQLAIPEAALREFEEAGKDLEKHDVESAVKRLEHAVDLAPQFAAAWNDLGTIAYQTQQYGRAEKCFRTALDQDPNSYEALVNLGGVLINTPKLDEALTYNQDAVLLRPNDALANSQLGLAYFAAGNFDLAVKYLEIARRIDPSHFSHPQLVLAEIHLRRGENAAAADTLEDFLRHHPDFPTADKIREAIAKLRK
jgi:tetratricopeptide (TPR) repeat protein